MSYILDALQRADTERDRGAVPGLHARQVNSPTLSAPSGSKARLWLALATVVGLVVLAAGLWLGRTGTATAPGLAATPQPTVVPQPLPLPLPLPLPAPSPVPIVGAAPEPATPSITQQNRAAATIAMPTAPVVEQAAPMPQARASASVRDAPPAAPPWLADLPQDTRSQVPPLTITGAVYSDNPAQRLLLVNGQVLPLGSAVTPDVTLEDIRERHSVFIFRGTRFRLAH